MYTICLISNEKTEHLFRFVFWFLVAVVFLFILTRSYRWIQFFTISVTHEQEDEMNLCMKMTCWLAFFLCCILFGILFSTCFIYFLGLVWYSIPSSSRIIFLLQLFCFYYGFDCKWHIKKNGVRIVQHLTTLTQHTQKPLQNRTQTQTMTF